MDIRPVTLEGKRIRLVPLSLGHHFALCKVGLDPELWTFTTITVRTQEDMLQYIESALEGLSNGTALPFAILRKPDGKAIGSTRYMNVDRENRRVEIGSTWLAKDLQRTAANTEAKYLLLTHAFEELGCIRVEFKTDALNTISREALLRIGATEEGTLRHHMIAEGGRIRDSVYFSIIDSEWPPLKKMLETKLSASNAQGKTK